MPLRTSGHPGMKHNFSWAAIVAVAVVCILSALTALSRKGIEGALLAPSAAIPKAVLDAEQQINDTSRDAESNKYRNVLAYTSSEAIGATVVCGELNTRNGFGGYTGFRSFVSIVSEPGPPFSVIANDDTMAALANFRRLLCQPSFHFAYQKTISLKEYVKSHIQAEEASAAASRILQQ